MDTDEHGLNLLTEKIIGCVYKVSNELGCGFLEKVYENSLKHELEKLGFTVEHQKPINIYYDGVLVGEYFGDLVVNGLVLLELKACKAFEDVHSAQCLNYLKATQLPVCLLINFGKPKVEIKRFVGESHRA